MLTELEAAGWEIGGEKLKTSPRGFDADHPRIDLLRHKSMTVGRSHGFEPVIHTPELLDVVRDDWRSLRPFSVDRRQRRLAASSLLLTLAARVSGLLLTLASSRQGLR